MKRNVQQEQLITLITQGAELALERRESELSEEELAKISAGIKVEKPTGGTSGLIYRPEDLTI